MALTPSNRSRAGRIGGSPDVKSEKKASWLCSGPRSSQDCQVELSRLPLGSSQLNVREFQEDTPVFSIH